MTSRPLLGIFFAAACAVIVYVGVPAPGVSPGDRAPRTYVARVSFQAVDAEQTALRRKIARERTLSVYSEQSDWRDEVTAVARALIEVAASSDDAETARSSLLADKGINLDPEPVWEALHSGDADARRRIEEAIEDAIGPLRRRHVISNERSDAERDSGRRRIIVGQENLVLATPGGSLGVTDVTAARKTIGRELRAKLTPKLAEAVIAALEDGLVPSLAYDEELSTDRRAQEAGKVADVPADVAVGYVMAREGETVGQTKYTLIQLEAATYYGDRPAVSHAMRLVGIFVALVAAVMALGAAMGRLEPRTLATLRTVFFAGALDLLVVAAARGLVVAGMPALLAPAALAGVVFALTVSPLFAAFNSVVVAAAIALAAGPDYAVPFALAAGAVAGAHAAARARRRSELLRAGVIAGIVQFLVTVGVKLATGVEDVPVLLEQGGLGLLNGFLCGLVALGLLHIAEIGFGVTTDISLLELSDQNHPALRKLLMEAPGTYHHSLIVGNLSETAALAIGGNALLARVASYYHDLGKADRPEYFTENEPLGRSRHEGLSPAMSTLIITSHVRDGVSLASDYRLPRAILDITAQHHGTSLVEFFYRTAMERAEGEPVDAQRFRYTGPKPRTKEAGIVLLADAVEAASRSLDEPTSARLKKLVHDLMMKRLLDGQFDESGLTLNDLRTIEDSFVKVLMSMFHTRVPYPSAPQGGRGAGLAGAPR
jgi:putative nucleotidyltransferase with HDIG domain